MFWSSVAFFLYKTYCKNNAIESHKGVISVIKIRGIATFDIKLHFCSGLMWDSVTVHRMKQTKQKSVKEIKNFHNLMQGAPWLMRFNFRGVHPGFRRLKFRVYPGSFTFWMHPKFCRSTVRMHPRFCSAFGVHPTFCSSTFRMCPGFWSLKLRVSTTFCSLTFRVQPQAGFWSISIRVHPTFCNLHSGWNLVFWCLTFRVNPTL